MEKKDINKLIVAVIAVLLVMAVIGGATFAYWQWVTSEEQQTLVNVTVAEGISMTIDPQPMTKTGMYPTNNCNGPAAMVGAATITVNNQTGILARPSFKLKAKVEKGGSDALPAAALAKINYAVFEGTATDCELENALATGTLSGGSTSGGWAHFPTAADTYLTNVTFDAAAYAETEHVYKVWVWLDSTYTAVNPNEGDTVRDPMQNATITVTWSENSIVEQILTQ